MPFFLMPFFGLFFPRSECRMCARKSSHRELIKSLLCCCYEITKHHTRLLRHGNAKILCIYHPTEGSSVFHEPSLPAARRLCDHNVFLNPNSFAHGDSSSQSDAPTAPQSPTTPSSSIYSDIPTPTFTFTHTHRLLDLNTMWGRNTDNTFSARKGTFDPNDERRIKHTTLGVWDLYEEREPKLARSPGSSRLEKYMDLLEGLPYLWRMLRDVLSIPTCMLLLLFYVTAEVGQAIFPALGLW